MDIRSLEITAEFLKLIAEIDEFKGSWKTLQSLSPERLQSLQHVATIESIGSSTRIEGSQPVSYTHLTLPTTSRV